MNMNEEYMDPGMDMGMEMLPGDVIMTAVDDILEAFMKLKVSFLAKEIELQKVKGDEEEVDDMPIDLKLLECIEYKNKMYNIISDHINMLSPQGSMDQGMMEEPLDEEEFVD